MDDIRHVDFYNCNYKFLNNKFMVKINNFSINYSEQPIEELDWITIYFNKELHILDLKYNDIQIEFNDGLLYINDDYYKIDYSEFQPFIIDFDLNEEQAIQNLMNHFCMWLLENYNER